MKRVTLTDGSGRWFDAEQAERWDEHQWFDGRNLISSATGSQWEHETLYRTSSGRWVLHSTSARQGVPDRWVELAPSRAAAWLVRNKKEPPEELLKYVEALEIR